MGGFGGGAGLWRLLVIRGHDLLPVGGARELAVDGLAIGLHAADEVAVLVDHVAALVHAVLRVVNRLPVAQLLLGERRHRGGRRLVRLARRCALRVDRRLLLRRLRRGLLALLLALAAAHRGRLRLLGAALAGALAAARRLRRLVRLARRRALRVDHGLLLGRLRRGLLALLLALAAALRLRGLRRLRLLGRGHPAAELLHDLRVGPGVVGGALRFEGGGELHHLGGELLEQGVVGAGGGRVERGADAAEEEQPRRGRALLRALLRLLLRLLLLRLLGLLLLGRRGHPGAELREDLRLGPRVVGCVLRLEEGGELHHGRLLRAGGGEHAANRAVEHDPGGGGLLGVAGGGHLRLGAFPSSIRC